MLCEQKDYRIYLLYNKDSTRVVPSSFQMSFTDLYTEILHKIYNFIFSGNKTVARVQVCSMFKRFFNDFDCKYVQNKLLLLVINQRFLASIYKNICMTHFLDRNIICCVHYIK